MLDLIDVSVRSQDQWPPADLPDTPLVIIANHPFGIGDGIAVLSLAEQLGRPFRVMIHAELLKIDEMKPYSLPIDFQETKEALKNNLAVRQEAVKLLKEGVTIVIFPAGGVATAPQGLRQGAGLPWKMFPARLVQEAKASVIPVHFSGQNGRLFHIVSGPMNMVDEDSRLKRMVGQVSLTLRTSLLIREFVRLSGKSISVRIGKVIAWAELEPLRDRKQLIAHLYRAVFSLAPEQPRPAARQCGAGSSAASADLVRLKIRSGISRASSACVGRRGFVGDDLDFLVAAGLDLEVALVERSRFLAMIV